MQLCGEMKVLRAELETECSKRKQMEQDLDRERQLVRALQERVTDTEKRMNQAEDRMASETSSRKSENEAVAARMDKVEVQLWQDGLAQRSRVDELEEYANNEHVRMERYLTNAAFVERIGELERTLREYSIAQDKETRMLVTRQSKDIKAVEEKQDQLKGSVLAAALEHHSALMKAAEDGFASRSQDLESKIKDESDEINRRVAVYAASSKQQFYDLDSKCLQAAHAQKEIQSAMQEEQKLRTDLSADVEILQEKAAASMELLLKADQTRAQIAARVEQLYSEQELLGKVQKMDIRMKIDSLEMFEVDVKKRLGDVEARATKIERVQLSALDDRLREEIAARERLEHRCRYLPTS
mmetsp:Transcript_22203/g.42351  ORF Transcript_22203/g.42351 Transcript_22203/m.42351 type:complete len:356 (+) Transcript_22203:119-1186(+)